MAEISTHTTAHSSKRIQIILGTAIALTILLLWLANLEIQKQINQTQALAASHQALRIRLENSIDLFPGQFVTEPQAWERYNANAENLWQLVNSLPEENQPSSGGSQERNAPGIMDLMHQVIGLQAEISHFQTELMSLRGMTDGMDYRMDITNSSLDLILSALLPDAKAPETASSALNIKLMLQNIEIILNGFWLPTVDRDNAKTQLATYLEDAIDTAKTLLEGKHAVTRSGTRREILSMVKNLEQLTSQSEHFAQGAAIIDQIDDRQREIEKHVIHIMQQALWIPAIQTRPGWSLTLITLLICVAWPGLCLYLNVSERHRPDDQQADQGLTMPLPVIEESQPTPDMSSLLHAMDLMGHGNLSHRIDDRQPDSRIYGNHFNQMASSLYRAFVEIHRAFSRLESQLITEKSGEPIESGDKVRTPITTLDGAINSTMELAGIVDQLENKISEGYIREEQHGESLKMLITRIDRSQALIRAILRDYHQLTGTQSAAFEVDNKSIREALKQLKERVHYFKLDMRR